MDVRHAGVEEEQVVHGQDHAQATDAAQIEAQRDDAKGFRFEESRRWLLLGQTHVVAVVATSRGWIRQ